MKIISKLCLMFSVATLVFINQIDAAPPLAPAMNSPLSKEPKKAEKKKDQETQKIAKEMADLEKKISGLRKETSSYQEKIENAQELIESYKKEMLNWQEADKLILRAEQLLQNSYFFNYQDGVGGPTVGSIFKNLRGKTGINDLMKGGSLGYYYRQLLLPNNPKNVEKRIDGYKKTIIENKAKIDEYEAKINRIKGSSTTTTTSQLKTIL